MWCKIRRGRGCTGRCESSPVCAGDGSRSSAVYKSQWTFKGTKYDSWTHALVSWNFTAAAAVPPNRPAFRLSRAEREELETQVQVMLEKGWIQLSSSPFGAPVLFVPKPDGSIDYCALNKIRIRTNMLCHASRISLITFRGQNIVPCIMLPLVITRSGCLTQTIQKLHATLILASLSV
jgi:hypothetical protein